MSAGAALYDNLLPRALPLFAFPSHAARCLVLGMGGGCDCFAAATLAKAWAEAIPTATVLHGNCIGRRPMPQDHTTCTTHLFRCPPDVRPLELGDEAYGSTRLETSIPRGPEGSPFLFVVPHKGAACEGLSAAEVTRRNTLAICEGLAHLRVEFVLACDLGGDSLTGGVDFESDPELGRDMQVLHALRASDVPMLHMVLGPGCDGESSIEAMRAAVQEADRRRELQAVLPLDDLALQMASLARTLAPSRTPNIIGGAMARKAEAAAGVAATDGDLCTISRHGRSRDVPWSWLTVALVFGSASTATNEGLAAAAAVKRAADQGAAIEATDAVAVSSSAASASQDGRRNPDG